MDKRMISAKQLFLAALFAATLPLSACDQVGNLFAGNTQEQNASASETDADEHQGGHDAEEEADAHEDAQGGHGEHEKAGHDEEPGHDDHEAEDGEHAEGKREIHLTENQRKRLDIQVKPAPAGSATALLQAPATVRFDADRVARLGPLLEAKVVEVRKDLGDAVGKGETVAVFDSVELGSAKARYLTAQARYGATLAEYQRDQKLADQQITSESELLKSKSEFLQAKAERDGTRAELRLYGLSDQQIARISGNSGTPLSRYSLPSPIAGTVQRRDLVPGQTVSAQETPIHIINSEQMWLMIEVYERDMARVKKGQELTLNVRALPGQSFTGITDWISSELDEQARTVRVRAVLPNEDGALRAGMFGTASIQTASEQRYALVPVDAVQTVDDEQVVFVPGDEEGAFRAVEVRTGEEGGGQIEILTGLQPGDAVVAQGAFDLNSALSAGSRSAEHSH
jgi:cobalt-zinc-cadmium efflux system membrane fusion protein